MTMKSQPKDGQTHYWLECDQGSCPNKQADAAISAQFCLSTAGQMGWRSDPATGKDYCPAHVPGAELDFGHAFVAPDRIAR